MVLNGLQDSIEQYFKKILICQYIYKIALPTRQKHNQRKLNDNQK